MQRYLYKDLFKLEEKHFWHIAKRNAVLWFIKRYLPRKKAKILDVGCGTGKNLESLKKFGEIWGIDNSLEAIKFCKKRGLENIKLASASETLFKSNSFDAVTMLDVLEHTDDKKALTEIYRILSPGGIVIITVPAYQWLWSRWDEALHHKRRYSKESLKSILKDCSFIPVKISYLYSFLIVPALVVRVVKSLFNPKKYPSDFQLSSSMLNLLLGKVAAAELTFVKNGSVPFGLSLIAIARKN